MSDKMKKFWQACSLLCGVAIGWVLGMGVK